MAPLRPPWAQHLQDGPQADPRWRTPMKKPSDNPADPFKKALAEATKVLAGDRELNISYSVDPSGVSGDAMRLPQISRRMTREEVLHARGTADALAMRHKYHNAKNAREIRTARRDGARHLRGDGNGPLRGCGRTRPCPEPPAISTPRSPQRLRALAMTRSPIRPMRRLPPRLDTSSAISPRGANCPKARAT